MPFSTWNQPWKLDFCSIVACIFHFSGCPFTMKACICFQLDLVWKPVLDHSKQPKQPFSKSTPTSSAHGSERLIRPQELKPETGRSSAEKQRDVAQFSIDASYTFAWFVHLWAPWMVLHRHASNSRKAPFSSELRWTTIFWVGNLAAKLEKNMQPKALQTQLNQLERFTFAGEDRVEGGGFHAFRFAMLVVLAWTRSCQVLRPGKNARNTGGCPAFFFHKFWEEKSCKFTFALGLDGFRA